MRVSIVVPTYNERENIGELVERVFSAFSSEKIDGELVVVDDNSPDGTGELAEKLAEKHDIKVVHRSGKLGLSSAVLEGFAKASGDVLGVMDADLSHPPEKIPELVEKITEGCDLVFGSRYVAGGRIENWPPARKLTSLGATMLARPLSRVKDPMSGFFLLKRGVIEGVKLNPRGYKIGLEILVRGRYGKVSEVPITFVDRRVGKSKLNAKEYLTYIRNLAGLYKHKLTH